MHWYGGKIYKSKKIVKGKYLLEHSTDEAIINSNQDPWPVLLVIQMGMLNASGAMALDFSSLETTCCVKYLLEIPLVLFAPERVLCDAPTVKEQAIVQSGWGIYPFRRYNNFQLPNLLFLFLLVQFCILEGGFPEKSY